MGAYIREAVESILNQSFLDFEFIIVDDASTDNSMLILDSIIDSRTVKIKNKSHQGNYRCRNQGLALAKGKYICVMDSDDIAHGDRLSKQLNFMEANREYIAAGTFVEAFDSNGHSSIRKYETNNKILRVFLLQDSVYSHPSLIFRREAYSMQGIKYNESYYYAGDYDLMVSLSKAGLIINMEDVLLRYRLHLKQITMAHRVEQINFADFVRLKQLEFFKIRPDMEEIMLYLRLMKCLPICKYDLPKIEKWLHQLIVQNQKLKIYDEDCLSDFLHTVFTRSISNAF
jgi:glycosyltransferase involved in cell wall biosynthesis